MAARSFPAPSRASRAPSKTGSRRSATIPSAGGRTPACPSAGAGGAQFTANTMATVSEAIGLALPYSAGAPAPYEIRDAFCMTAGEQIVELIKAGLRPRDIVTRKALENAAAVVSASG